MPFPKQRLRNQKKLELVLGLDASCEVLSGTPIGVNSPKRKLAWTPETPNGRSRKYSIGDNASPKLRQNVSGVITLNGRFAIPSMDSEITDTIDGLDELKINVSETDGVIMTEDKDSKVARSGVGNLKSKVVPNSIKGKKKRKAKRSLITPGQKLITDMLNEKLENSNNESYDKK